jgi:hypothetical protein
VEEIAICELVSQVEDTLPADEPDDPDGDGPSDENLKDKSGSVKMKETP